MANNVLYMIVTADKYELPMAVAGSIDELSRMGISDGRTSNNLSSQLSKNKNPKRGSRLGCRILKVRI